MAGAIAHGQGVSVMFVRHGESTNNPIYRGLFKRLDDGSLTMAEVERQWLSARQDDPSLTEAGASEAVKLGAYLAEGLSPTARVDVYTSAFKRSLDTTKGMLSTLSKGRTADAAKRINVRCHPDIFETGGVYRVDPSTGKRVGPGACMSAADVAAAYPGFDTSLLPPSGQWYTGGWETDGEGRARAERVAAWLRSDEFRENHEGALVVLVMHGHFIDALQKALVGIRDDPSKDPVGMNSFREQPVQFSTANTATSLFEVARQGTVVVRWVGSTAHLGRPPREALGLHHL